MKDLARELVKKKKEEQSSSQNHKQQEEKEKRPNRVASIVKHYAKEIEKKSFLLHLNMLTFLQVLNCCNYLIHYEKPIQSSLHILHVLLIISYISILFIRDSSDFFSEHLSLTHLILESSNIIYYFIIMNYQKSYLSFLFMFFHLFKCMLINCSFSLEVGESLFYYITEIAIMFIFNGEGTTMQRVVNNIFSANGIYLCIIFALIAKIHKEYVTTVQESTALIEWINWFFTSIWNLIMKQNYRKKI